MDAKRVRAWHWHRQGLDGSLEGKSPAAALETSGWARSVGGVGPYLTLFSRAGVGREAVDGAAAKLAIHELPAARGCTYVVPAKDFALALKVGQGFGEVAEQALARKLGVKDAEIEKLCAAVLKALGREPLAPDAMREAVGGAARSLGDAGKKKGLTTTLPVALGLLQAAGEIRRIPVDGRLDQQRYKYTLWRPNPLAKFRLSKEEAAIELARRFFRWGGPASLADWQAFCGLGVKDSKAAAAPLGLVELEPGDGRMLFPEDREALLSLAMAKKAEVSLVSSLDALFLLRRDAERFVDAADAKKKFFASARQETGGALKDLPSHAIVDRGRIIGLWEYDPAKASIAWTSFVPADKAIKAAVARTEAFVRDDLGDARSFSLDSPKSRAPRIEMLRAR